MSEVCEVCEVCEMARGLPEGLVSNRVGVSDEIERVDRVEAEDVQKLWRGTMPL